MLQSAGIMTSYANVNCTAHGYDASNSNDAYDADVNPFASNGIERTYEIALDSDELDGFLTDDSYMYFENEDWHPLITGPARRHRFQPKGE